MRRGADIHVCAPLQPHCSPKTYQPLARPLGRALLHLSEAHPAGSFANASCRLSPSHFRQHGTLLGDSFERWSEAIAVVQCGTHGCEGRPAPAATALGPAQAAAAAGANGVLPRSPAGEPRRHMGLCAAADCPVVRRLGAGGTGCGSGSRYGQAHDVKQSSGRSHT